MSLIYVVDKIRIEKYYERINRIANGCFNGFEQRSQYKIDLLLGMIRQIRITD